MYIFVECHLYGSSTSSGPRFIIIFRRVIMYYSRSRVDAIHSRDKYVYIYCTLVLSRIFSFFIFFHAPFDRYCCRAIVSTTSTVAYCWIGTYLRWFERFCKAAVPSSFVTVILSAINLRSFFIIIFFFAPRYP